MKHNLSLSVLAMASVLAMGACSSTKAQFEHSPVATAAEPKLKVSKTDNGNTALDFKVKYLPPAAKVRPDATSYVVWARPENSGPTMNLGAMKLNDKLEGHLKTLTPFKDFQLLVTPEANITAQAPTSDPVLWARVDL
jgi:hypothetical protein